MPKLSDTMTEGTLVRWLKNEGDSVDIGEVIAEVETDKATMEMEAFDEGTLAKVYTEEGTVVQVGESIAFIAGEGEEAPAERPAGEGEGESEKESDEKEAKSEGQEPKGEPEPEQKAQSTAGASNGDQPATGSEIKASPLARKMATEHGLDMRSMKGSGPGGRIVKRDIEEALQGGGAKAAGGKKEVAKGSPVEKTPAPAATAQDERISLSSMRRVIADRLVESKTTIPHFYLTITCDAGPLMELRKQINAHAEESGGVKFTINDFLLRATVLAARRVPEVNASFDGDAIIQYGSVQLAVAVAIDAGLITPVIKNAESRSLSDISAMMKDLANRARDKKLKPEEYQGGTITVSNLGSYGIESFDAIINPPQAAILSVGTISKEPVVNDKEEIVVGHRMRLGLSCDHRVVDGAVGSRFLAEMKKLVETPYLILV